MNIASVLPTTNLSAGASFEAYLNHVNSLPILSKEEEQDLFSRLKEQNDLQAARDIILSHLRFVAYVAKSYSGYGLPLEDLVQEGTVGLMKSVKQFDPSRGVRLASFAVYWIKSEIHEYVIRNWKMVKVATTKVQRKLFFNLRKLKQSVGWITKEDAKEISDYLDVSEKDVLEMDARLSQTDSYIDETFGEYTDESNLRHRALSQVLEDQSTNPETHLMAIDVQHQTKQRLQHALDQLDERARDIIQSRWLVDSESKLSLKDLSERYGVSIERVRQVEAKAIQLLQKFMQEECE